MAAAAPTTTENPGGARVSSTSTAAPIPPPGADTAGAEPTPLRRYWQPRFWPVWALWVWMRFTACLPLDWALFVHERLGAVLYRVRSRERRVVLRNLELCFPELTHTERTRLAKRHFESYGAALAECAVAWFAPDARLENRFDVVGLENLTKALAHGKGVVLYTGHFTALEISGRILKTFVPELACMFSHRSNELMNEIQRRGRRRCAHQSISNGQVRSMLSSLKRNAVVWYASDQFHDGRSAALIPFFSEPAMTNTAASRIARSTGAAVIPFAYRRLALPTRYELRFYPPLDDFPSADPAGDTRRLVLMLEQFIRASPEQYLWAHRRFKRRTGLPDAYARNARYFSNRVRAGDDEGISKRPLGTSDDGLAPR